MKLPTLCLLLTATVLHAAEPAFEKEAVTLWSDGTRMAGDLYLPAHREPGQKLPGIVFCSGTGGIKKTVPVRYGQLWAAQGFAVLAFDYRGWGESDARLMLPEPMPKPDAEGFVTVKARPVRWQLDFADQTWDIRCAISFLTAEPGIDPQRIGIIGTSYGGGLVAWVAGHDPRVKCAAVQVPGMGGGRGPAATKYAYDLMGRQARGETEPVPFETGKLGGNMAAYDFMRANPAKGIGYDVFEAAARITAPFLIIVAENEELMKNEENGHRVFNLLQQRHVDSEYHILPGITHYGVYKEAFAAAEQLELGWFKKHLQPAP